MKRPLIIAHRGASFYERENTLKAYKKALEMGVDGIEMDLRMTSDGVLVCHHDRGVKNGDGERCWIDKLTWKKLKEIKNGEVVKFEEMIKRLNKTYKSYKSYTANTNLIFDLDLKQEGMEREIVRILKKYKIKKVLVNSTDIWTLKAFEDVWPAAELVLSYHPKDPRDLINHKTVKFLTLLVYYSLKPLLFRLIRRKTAIGDINAASLNYRLVNTKVVQFLHQYNIKVFVWGTEDVKKLRCLVKLGVDGVKTRRPELLKQLLEKKISK